MWSVPAFTREPARPHVHTLRSLPHAILHRRTRRMQGRLSRTAGTFALNGPGVNGLFGWRDVTVAPAVVVVQCLLVSTPTSAPTAVVVSGGKQFPVAPG